ncbi:MAG: caspase family protein [Saprospiraceae bacterium]|nr:caspase family protein [Saprospiraceae bacterium]MCF8252746.1 caspase family protein [Saprospiraceae bacterium]MCF8280518.1 caspase family protein [Bacteroidales bacterium]MCF8312306.1 caspase family protein [Saprospiraceae bacterium]MCF8443161.1 caspase family protein [Saprospiraceae bacterium]
MKKLQLTTGAIFLFTILALAQKPELGIPVGHAGRIFSVDFSPDGNYAVSCSEDKTIRLWEVTSGRLLKLWEPYRNEVGSAPVLGVGFGRDGKYIIEGALIFGKSLQTLDIESQDTGNVRVFIDPTVEVAALQPSTRVLCTTADGDQVLTLTAKNDLKFWNVKNGKLLKTLPKQMEDITSLCMTPDGHWAYAGHKDGSIRRWDLRKGQPDAIFKNVHSGEVKSLAVSSKGEMLLSASEEGSLKLLRTSDLSATPIFTFPDSYVLGSGQGAVFSKNDSTIAYATGDKAIVLWDVAKQQQIVKLPPHEEEVSALRFSPDGTKLLSGDSGKSLIIWDLVAQKPMHILNGTSLVIKQAFFSQNKKNVVTVSEFRNIIVSWNGLTGAVDRVFVGHRGDVIATCVSPNGRYLISSAEDKQVILWDFETAEKLGVLPTKSDKATSIAISPNNKYVLTGTADHLVVLWDLEEKKPLKSFTSHSEKVTSVAFSPDSKWAMSGSDDNTVAVYDVELRKQTSTIPGQATRWSPVAFAPDGKSFLSISCEGGKVEWWDILTKKIKKTFSLQNGTDAREPDILYCTTVSTVAFSPEGDRFLLSSGNDVLLWNLNEDKPKFLHGHQSLVRSVCFSSDGRLAMSAGNDGSIRLWNGQSGKALCTVLQLGGADWAAITPEGQFDGSPKALEKMYYVLGLETIELSQMKNRYYEPDMLPILLGLKSGSLREVPAFSDFALFPELTATINKGKLEIDLKKRGRGSYGKVVVAVNGTDVLSDACGGKGGCKFDLVDFKRHFYATDSLLSKNEIAVRVYNEEGWMNSSPKILRPFSKGRGTTNANTDFDGIFELGMDGPPDPGFYAIVIGTSEYPGSLKLGYPDLDAHAMDTTLRVIARGTDFFKDRVDVTLLSTDAADPNLQPSKKNIRAAFKRMETTHPEDVLVVYFAGHGKTFMDNGKEDFYYLTKDVGEEMNLENDAGLRNSICVSTDSLNEWLNAIPAKKRVMIFDACQSGAAAEALKSSRAPQSSQKREMDRLKSRTGTFVLAGCEANQKSYENDDLKQGLLTYSLLFGLESRKGTTNEGAVDIQTLFQFAADEVPNLTSLGQDQKPVLTVPSGEASSFSIGWVHPETKILVERKNQFILQSMFLNQEGFNDTLGLSVAFDQRLKAGEVGGKLGEMIFADTRQMKDACAVRGLYQVKDGKISLEGRVFFPGAAPKEFKLENVPVNDVRGVVEQVIEAVNGKL